MNGQSTIAHQEAPALNSKAARFLESSNLELDVAPVQQKLKEYLHLAGPTG